MSLRRHIPSASALLAFEAAARLGSFSRAAEELNITQPAVSHAIAAMERHLGQKLFIRSGPRLILTENGEKLGRVTTRSFGAIQEVFEDIEGRDPTRETVMLSISSGMATHWLMPRYDRFRDHFPQVDLQFQLIPGSVGGPLYNCDLGLRVASGEDSAELDGMFTPERILAVCSPAYLSDFGKFESPRRPQTLIALPDHWFGWPEFAHEARYRLTSDGDRLSFSDYSVCVQAALSGQGVALGWTSVTSRLLADGLLVPASDTVVVTGRSYHFVTSSQRATRPIVQAVREWLIKEMHKDEAELEELLA
ncbi:LysR family transcriptional regulator [Pelagibacterium flavum]|uniref:LysR family transcriptional regulator n=1 Tax=Pelagibacterium flavum TaxID=2984530 RepID=A0ABY6IJV9_9HYPH|nr:LysR family transcriptional regulator [Pelagibacterium sp. YIM 151497]UYQ70893.1 LysR family transcriptional regulator [Pelagibacterium sp. YIM 151497]